jgi:hypothetical protein
MILIEFLEMVVQNIAYARVRIPPLAMVPTWVIPLRTFQYSMVGKVGVRLDRRLRPMLLTPFQATMDLAPYLIRRIFGRFHYQSLPPASLRLNPRLYA